MCAKALLHGKASIAILVRYILSLTNQRSWFQVRRLQHHQQIKAHGQHMVNKT
jgi:hypothetical protein